MEESETDISHLRIGFILSQFPCYDETFILRELSALSESGLDLHIFSLKPCRDQVVHPQALPLLDRVEYTSLFFSCAVWRAFFFFLLIRPVRFFRALGEMVFALSRSADFLLKGVMLFPLSCSIARRAEVLGLTHLHGMWATHPATVALLVHRMTDIPWGFTGHAHDIHTNTVGLAHKLRSAGRVFTCTSDNRRYLIALAGEAIALRVHLVYHGLDVDHAYTPFDGILEQPFRIVSVGSLLPCKGYEVLLNACALLKKQGIGFHCTLVGGGPLETTLRSLTVDLSLENQITFTGYVSQSSMPNYYQQAHCFVLASVPAIHWGIPNVILEAMACGLPVITTRLPSLSEVLESDGNGILVEEPSAETIAEALIRLADDPDTCHRLGRAARNTVVERFSLKNTVAVLLNALSLQEDEE